MKTLHKISLLICLGSFLSFGAAEDIIESGCTYHKYTTCDPLANCTDIDETHFECKCPEGYEGDGLRDGQGCSEKPCVDDNDCSPYAICTEEHLCRCREGFEGSPRVECTDIDECAVPNICHRHATCNNTFGSYECRCKSRENYIGNGTHCVHKCYADTECDVKTEICNVDQTCVCKSGFREGVLGCANIDECSEGTNECHVNATCTDTEGSYNCTCKNGFSGNGVQCERMPLNCDEIKRQKPNARNGDYIIDPDGEGPLGPVKVRCQMRPGLGITILTVTKRWFRFTSTSNPITYSYRQSILEILAVIETSGFCYQEMSSKCSYGGKTMSDGDYVIIGNGTHMHSWGGSDVDNTCLCGKFNICAEEGASCNCNGGSESRWDEGKIIDKSILPVLGLKKNPDTGNINTKMGDVYCAAKSFDMPVDCDEAKTKYNKKKNGPQLIDLDGDDGGLEPIYVLCDMETCNHVGVTVISHDRLLAAGKNKAVKTYIPHDDTSDDFSEKCERISGDTPSDPGTHPLKYTASQGHIEKLIEISGSCSQTAEYTCKNSRLLNHDSEMMGYVSSFSKNLSYWPGGMKAENMCGCGILRQCDVETEGCNCNTKDGKTRKDFGVITDKDDLPVASITLNEIDGDISTGTYRIGALRCSKMDCGILPSCQDYVEKGNLDSYTYLIDPDGPDTASGNQPPFPVYCEIHTNPNYGITRIHHMSEQLISVLTTVQLVYMWVNIEQVTALVERSSSCIQSVKYSCRSAPLHHGGESTLEWRSREGELMSHLHGDSNAESSCICGLDDSCDGSGKCSCDVNDDQDRTDRWTYTEKRYLPVQEMTVQKLSNDSHGFVEIGPMECKELMPTCSDLKAFKNKYRLISEYVMSDGNYVINPEGDEGVQPFTVRCEGTRTVLPTDIEDNGEPTDGKPDEPVTRCYEINYNSVDNSPVSKEQVQALVASSKYCAQTLSVECTNAPLTGQASFSTCDGVQQTGWAGSHGDSKCACGVTGSCQNGAACNCDVEDGETRSDGGWVVSKERLGICEVCFTLNSTSSLTTDPKKRTVKPTVSDLYCDKKLIGTGKSCQDWREQGETQSGPVMVSIPGAGPTKLFPIFCNLETSPPFGNSEIPPTTPENPVPPNGTVIIEYFEYEFQYTVELIQMSRYCTQELVLQCESSYIYVNGEGIWNSIFQDTSECDGGFCLCNGTYSVVVNDTTQLPIRKIELGSSSGTRTVILESVKCFDLYPTCHDIKLNKAANNPFGDNVYTIDPDQGGLVPEFAVTCDFKTDNQIGITEVKVNKPSDRTVKNQTDPGSLVVNVDYGPVTPEQIFALAQVSAFCIQSMQYTCKNSPLINGGSPLASYYSTYGGGESQSFGVPGHSDTVGCACVMTNTCPLDSSCHCDALGKMRIDYGYETNNDHLPIVSFHIGGQQTEAYAYYDFTGVDCGPKYFGLPENCQKVLELGKKSGEHLIWPVDEVEPFLVYCDMDTIQGTGITIIKNELEVEKVVTYGGPVNVTYYDATFEQAAALVSVSKYCYQGFIYTCRNTKMLSGDGFFSWEGRRSGRQEKYTGGGRYFTTECHCGSQGKCGGSEDRETLISLQRTCNCDAADNLTRADAGIFAETSRLPVKSLLFEPTGTSDPYGAVKLGKLMCAEKEFDINECKEGFHDCHEKADCINLVGSYECICKPGWRGKGRPDVWANGRNCYNDDECAKTVNYCPLHSICTDTPGSYECECEKGFRPKGSAKQKCIDIDECTEGTHNCDVNADCYNTPGSYVCRCRRNFRGNGTICKPLAQCAVFGDPHVITLDERWYSFQGMCDYVLSRDNCGPEDGPPTYELTSSFYRKYPHADKHASWVKSVKLNIFNHVIELLQNNEVRVDGLKINPTYIEPQKFSIYRFGGRVEVRTALGVEVTWDGSDATEVFVPGGYFNKTCGMCGTFNGNSSDDLMAGPQCTEVQGNIVDNVALFGNSWLTPGNEVCTANCSTDEEHECPPEKEALAKYQCRRIYGQHKKFRECLEKMEENNADLVRVYFQICVYDMCRLNSDVEQGLCDHAKHLLEICSALVGVEVETFRTETFCPPDCPENMDYHSCKQGPMETCYDHLNNSKPVASESAACQEGCFCKEGFLADGDLCVLPEDCGCIYNDKYYQKEEVITLDECSRQIKCEGNDQLSFQDDLKCHENATCEIKNGIYGCHCNDGFYGDGVEICIEDPCVPNPCGGNETCVHNLESSLYYECNCNPGFFGDCGNCTEMDECNTELNDCPKNSECINTIGSFECKCHDGFVMSGNLCHDINDCSLAEIKNETLCGENEKCVNKIGTYTCPCCAGFEKDSNGKCVASSSAAAAAGEKCCYCYGPKCEETKKVCGTDHKTYNSWKDLMITRCQESTHVKVDYYGKCKPSCSADLCPKHQTCEISSSTGKPTCVCEPCTEAEKSSGRVCTSKNDIYENECIFKMAQCQQDAEATIVDNIQTCEDFLGEFPVGPWSSWSPCSVTCGKGAMTRTREGTVSDDFTQKYPLTVNKDCYEDPCEGPCQNNTECAAKSAECVVENGEAKCECPTCDHVEHQPVCGYVVVSNKEPNLKTWPSACDLQKNACQRGLDHEVYDIENCHVDPVECTTIPELRYVLGGDNDEYSSARKMDLPKCGGGCGPDKSNCCQPSGTETITVTLQKVGKPEETIQHTIEKILECECRQLVP